MRSFILILLLTLSFNSFSQLIERNQARGHMPSASLYDFKYLHLTNQTSLQHQIKEALPFSTNKIDKEIKNKTEFNTANSTLDSIKLGQEIASLIFERKVSLLVDNIRRMKLKEAQLQLLFVKDTLDEVDINTGRLVNYTWDIFRKIDSVLYISNNAEFVDTLLFFRTNIERFQYRLVEKAIDSVEQLQSDLELEVNNEEVLPDTASAINLQKRISNLKIKASELKARLWQFLTHWDSITKKYIKEKEKVKKINVQGLPFFSAIPGAKEYNGNLNLIGQSIPSDKDGLYMEFGAYTGILNRKDSSNVYNIFISDVSNYGFYWKGNIGLVPQVNENFKRIGFNIFLAYLNKPIPGDSSMKVNKDFNSSVFHTRLGIEIAIHKEIFSIYSNLNSIGFVTNKATMQQRFSGYKDLISYPDFGFRFLLDPAIKHEGNLKLYFDLNFLVNNRALKIFNTDNNDPLIPNFRIGLRANIGKL